MYRITTSMTTLFNETNGYNISSLYNQNTTKTINPQTLK